VENFGQKKEEEEVTQAAAGGVLDFAARQLEGTLSKRLQKTNETTVQESQLKNIEL